MTDGYGDYVRHYLRAMAAAPQLAPDNENHLLRSSSIVKKVEYKPKSICYITYDNDSKEMFRLVSKPSEVRVNGQELDEAVDQESEGWTWRALATGGVLTVNKSGRNEIEVTVTPRSGYLLSPCCDLFRY